jgi:hypothetical protein
MRWKLEFLVSSIVLLLASSEYVWLLLEIVPSQVMILYEGNALEVGVTSCLLCYVARVVRMYDGAVIIYILLTPH